MFKLECDPMAAVLLGAADSALSGIMQSAMPQQSVADGAERAKSQAQSVVGDLMGWSRDAGRPLSDASLGNLLAPSCAPAGGAQLGWHFGW